MAEKESDSKHFDPSVIRFFEKKWPESEEPTVYLHFAPEMVSEVKKWLKSEGVDSYGSNIDGTLRVEESTFSHRIKEQFIELTSEEERSAFLESSRSSPAR